MDNGESSYRRFLDGDDEGLRTLIDDYYDGLVLYLNTYLRDEHEAEDMAEETFVILATKKPRFDGASSFRTWLYSIAGKITASRLRKKRAVPVDIRPGTAARDLTAVEDAYIREESKRELRAALDSLQAEYRQVLWLYFFEDMAYGDIAKIMKKTLPGVDHLMRRAKAELKEEMIRRGLDHT